MSASVRADAILAELPSQVWQPIDDSWRPVRIAEIGVHKGELSALLLEARPDIKLILVDHWRATADYPGDRLKDFAEAMKNLEPHRDRVAMIVDDSIAAVRLFSGQLFDLVFIDACHDYPAVAADIKAWKYRVRAGGVLGGHDYYKDNPDKCPGVKRAVDEAFPAGFRLRQNATWFVTM